MFAGIDIGGTNIKYGVVDTDSSVLSSSTEPTQAHEGKDVVIKRLRVILRDLTAKFPKLQAVGIGFPSVVHPDSGVVQDPPNMPGWGVVPLGEELQKTLKIPICIENDANVAAVAECQAGAGKDHTHFLYVTLGTGIGGAIISNSHIYHGERGGAGEIGHVIINMNDEPTEEMLLQNRSYRTGVLESYAGKEAIIRLALELAKVDSNSLLNNYISEELDVLHISHAAHQNDWAAKECLKKVGKYLGLGIASALSLLDLRVVIVGGGISKAHPILLQTTLETLRLRTLHSISTEVQVLPAHFEENAGMIGAALLAKQKFGTELTIVTP